MLTGRSYKPFLFSKNYKVLEVFGPEHEFSIVDENIKPKPIVDKVIKYLSGRIRRNASFSDFVFGKELQKHVGEFKAIYPFRSPKDFEETMYSAVNEISGVLDGFGAQLLGMGMHPTLNLKEAEVWDHQDRRIYKAFDKIFDLRQHGWLNIQSFQLNLPYFNEPLGVRLYNTLKNVLPYISAISAASPIYESRFGEFVDNRLYFYWINQARIPSITGDIIPEPIDSFKTYRKVTIQRYSTDLIEANAPSYLLNKEWINSRGAIFRFDRRAIEIRIMDEQESIKSDVAMSCFIRALLRGLSKHTEADIPHSVLVKNLRAIMGNGLNAKVSYPKYSTAREVCQHLLDIAYKNASEEERSYLQVVKSRIDGGSLSERVSQNLRRRMQRTDREEAIISIYSELATMLRKNEVYR